MVSSRSRERFFDRMRIEATGAVARAGLLLLADDQQAAPDAATHPDRLQIMVAAPSK